MDSSATMVWSCGRPVERRRDDLTLHRALHVGDFFWPLVDEHHHEVAFRVVHGDRVGDRLQHHRLAGLRRRDDQRPLPLPIGITRSITRVVSMCGSVSSRRRYCGYSGVSLVNSTRFLRRLRVTPVHRVQADQRVVLLPALAVAGLPDRAGDGIAAPQAEAADVGIGDVDVLRAGEVAGRPHEPGVLLLERVEDACDRNENVVLGHGRLGIRAAAARRLAPDLSRLRPRRSR